MELIPNPQKVEYNSENEKRGQFIIEPLYPGYGITMGNMLRRVILSSIPGSAVTNVKINGVEHEFSTMPYVKEDLVDIILNIKQIKIRVEQGVDATAEEPLVMKINKTGEGKVMAGDIEAPSQIDIVNKDLVIATLTDKAAVFNAEFIVENGRGYLPVENFKSEKFGVGYIAVDAIFTPIYQVIMDVERVRVGGMTNWDKLILTIETDGSITPQGAFSMAVDILYEQLNFLKNKNNSEKSGGSSAIFDIKGKDKKKKEKEKDADEKNKADEKDTE
ncbi:MAG: DNA-directed RNA polymerase subunit alpha [Candidatus Kuenenbacteria bacterium]